MEQKDYYNILGLSRDASDKEIKKKFRELSRLYHPDRQAGKSDEEKKEAEEKFKEINQAYSVLSDPEKKSNYDQYGDENGPSMGGFNPFGPGFNPFGGGGFDPFSSFFGGRQTRRVERGKDIRVKVKISLEELFNGTTKKIKYNRLVKCVNCHGTGGTGVKICPDCGGTGMMQKRTMVGPNSWSIETAPCNKCHGTGKIVEHKCPTCNGDGLVSESCTAEFIIKPGMIHNESIIIAEKGSEARSRDGITGDLEAVVIYDFLDREDLELTVEQGKVHVVQHIAIPYYDLLLGIKYNLELPYGGNMDVSIPHGIHDGYIMAITRNKAVDYSIAIHYKFPDKISDEEKTLIEQIKKLH